MTNVNAQEENFWDDRTTPGAYSQQDSERDMARLHRVEEIAQVIARTYDGWNDDTTEPTIADPAMRAAAEKHWKDVNESCLKMARKAADALLASDIFAASPAVQREEDEAPKAFCNLHPDGCPQDQRGIEL